ncbi:MAG: hypothetical protein MJE77_47985 [Proteobacteria bacterium]|nr:hypothetical protein [Pseudomonadota bacterium]
MTKLNNADMDQLIHRTVQGDMVAREELFRHIQQFLTRMELRPLGPYSRDPDCVGEVCTRVVSRLIINDHQRLRSYLGREKRCFASFLRVVASRVAIDLARGMRQNVAPRHESVFRWVQEVEYSEPECAQSSNLASRLQLLDVRRYLRCCADPVDADLLTHSVSSSQSWQEIASRHNLTPNAARQRVSRLRKSMRAWLEQHNR